MQSISILGCGWLGLPLGRHLAQLGYNVKGSTTNESKISILADAGIKPYCFKLNPNIEGKPGDFFASDLLIVNLPPRNQNGVTNFHEDQLLTILKHSNSKHVIFISSTAVYPSTNSTVTEIDASTACLSRGGIPLLKMEKLFSENPSFECTVIRFGGLYGPDRHPGRFLAGKKNLAGANNPINMIHLDDCIGVIQSIIKKEIWGEIFNASAPSQQTRQFFYEKASKELGIEAPTFSNEKAPYKIVSSNKLIQKTGYKFKY